MNRAGGTRAGISRAVGAAVVTVVLLSAGSPLASAADPEPAAAAQHGQLTWAVSPTEKDSKSRALFEYSVEPGEIVKDSLEVHVIGSTPISFQVYGSDATLSDDGVFDVLAAAKPSKDVGSWVTMERDRLTVKGEDSVEIPFILAVPENATPGDHVGGIVTSVGSDVDAGDRGTVRLDRRLGARIYLRVAGALAPAFAVSKPTVSYKTSANPVGGKTTVSYTVTNTGNTRLQAARNIKVSGLLSGANLRRDLPELLPGAMLSFTDTLDGPRFAGPGKVTVAVEPRDQLQGELPTSAFAAAAASASLWALPWSQLILLFLAFVAVAGFAAQRRRSRSAVATDAPSPSVVP